MVRDAPEPVPGVGRVVAAPVEQPQLRGDHPGLHQLVLRSATTRACSSRVHHRSGRVSNPRRRCVRARRRARARRCDRRLAAPRFGDEQRRVSGGRGQVGGLVGADRVSVHRHSRSGHSKLTGSRGARGSRTRTCRRLDRLLDRRLDRLLSSASCSDTANNTESTELEQGRAGTTGVLHLVPPPSRPRHHDLEAQIQRSAQGRTTFRSRRSTLHDAEPLKHPRRPAAIVLRSA